VLAGRTKRCFQTPNTRNIQNVKDTPKNEVLIFQFEVYNERPNAKVYKGAHKLSHAWREQPIKYIPWLDGENETTFKKKTPKRVSKC